MRGVVTFGGHRSVTGHLPCHMPLLIDISGKGAVRKQSAVELVILSNKEDFLNLDSSPQNDSSHFQGPPHPSVTLDINRASGQSQENGNSIHTSEICPVPTGQKGLSFRADSLSSPTELVAYPKDSTVSVVAPVRLCCEH
ncbi:hypothetical protein STEG23_032911 [Scotinomys teguina]